MADRRERLRGAVVVARRSRLDCIRGLALALAQPVRPTHAADVRADELVRQAAQRQAVSVAAVAVEQGGRPVLRVPLPPEAGHVGRPIRGEEKNVRGGVPCGNEGVRQRRRRHDQNKKTALPRHDAGGPSDVTAASAASKIRDRPIDRLPPSGGQPRVDARERLAAEEAAMRRQRARVRRTEDQMLRAVDAGAFRLGVAAPENEGDRLLPRVQRLDDAVRERLPPLPLVRVRLPAAHGQHRVEEQHALLRPRSQVAVVRNRRADVVPQFFENILQRRRCRHPRLHREAEAVRLPRPVIRVLPEDDDLHCLVRRRMQRIENIVRSRVDRLRPVFLLEKFPEPQIVRQLELIADLPLPIVAQNAHPPLPPIPNKPACPSNPKATSPASPRALPSQGARTPASATFSAGPEFAA